MMQSIFAGTLVPNLMQVDKVFPIYNLQMFLENVTHSQITIYFYVNENDIQFKMFSLINHS